jgi:hypothetical protein
MEAELGNVSRSGLHEYHALPTHKHDIARTGVAIILARGHVPRLKNVLLKKLLKIYLLSAPIEHNLQLYEINYHIQTLYYE